MGRKKGKSKIAQEMFPGIYKTSKRGHHVQSRKIMKERIQQYREDIIRLNGLKLAIESLRKVIEDALEDDSDTEDVQALEVRMMKLCFQARCIERNIKRLDNARILLVGKEKKIIDLLINTDFSMDEIADEIGTTVEYAINHCRANAFDELYDVLYCSTNILE